MLLPRKQKVLKDIGLRSTFGTQSTTAKSGVHSCENPPSKNPLVLVPSEENITRVVRNLAIARKKRMPCLGIFCLFSCVWGKEGQEKTRAQPWYARKSGKSPGQLLKFGENFFMPDMTGRPGCQTMKLMEEDLRRTLLAPLAPPVDMWASLNLRERRRWAVQAGQTGAFPIWACASRFILLCRPFVLGVIDFWENRMGGFRKGVFQITDLSSNPTSQ